MVLEDAQIRLQLISFCENSKCRRVSHEYPHSWTPGLVINPDTGDMKLAFTDSSAWAFTAELIKSNSEIKIIPLDVPKGKNGFVILHQMPCKRYLYIKLMFGNGCVLGRSFHYSEHTFETVIN